MKRMLFHKYPPYPPVGLSDRRWPDRIVECAPPLVQGGLRNGSQALSVPMDVGNKKTARRWHSFWTGRQ